MSDTLTRMQPIGFGMWQISNEARCRQAVAWALQAGYRHFDTAQLYGNEQFLGEALQAAYASGQLKREDIFITTKIHPKNFGRRKALRSISESLAKLQTDYVDLLLLHFPMPLLRDRSWQALVETQAAGQAHQIGVSNYSVRHLKQLARHSPVRPFANQVELHVYLQQPELRAYCASQQITIEAYSPLAHGKGHDDPVLRSVAHKYGKTPAQIMLRWCVEQGTIPLPKSTHQERIQENFAVFDFKFDAADRVALQKLDKNLRTLPNPRFIP